MSKAEGYLNKVYGILGLSNKSKLEKYQRIYDIIKELENINKEETISVVTTGKITELILSLMLESITPNSFYENSDKNNKWLGDFILFGLPLNIVISVKSFKAKERLLVSGSGSSLVPTIGYGLFSDPKEFKNIQRLNSYRLRGFTSIYMPNYTYEALSDDAKNFKNVNDNYFLRKIEDFGNDLRKAIEVKKLINQDLEFVNSRKL